MADPFFSLERLGWDAFFSDQRADIANGAPMRLHAVNRQSVGAFGASGPEELHIRRPAGDFAVGDWILAENGRVEHLFDRKSLIKRRAAGQDLRFQLIAANVDTLGIVTSCNADFNIARLERYLAMAYGSGCKPLIIITKSDLTDDPDSYTRALEPLGAGEPVVLNATDPQAARAIAPWCDRGLTLALVGSSGVGKTTLQNALTGETAETRGIREDDARGRHTTTARSLRATRFGGWVIDTPGMRELRLADDSGIGTVFADLEHRATKCKFRNCSHQHEPGCAIRAGLDAGDIDPDRARRWQSLAEESAASDDLLDRRRRR